MKKLNKLFAILIAVLGVQTLSAQTWTAPVIGQDLKDVSNSTELYMYNVKADAFACSGMSWGTHATVKELQNGDTKLSADVHRCRVSKPTDGQLQIMLNEKSFLGGGGPSSTNDCWVDHGSHNVYIYNEVSDNVYTLKPTTATNESYLDCAWAYGGHITFSATNGYGNTEWAFVLRSDITNGKYLLYKAKKEMYDIYQALVDAGHDGTYADALATANAAYTASNATAASVNAATKTLLAEVAPALSSKYFAANSLFNNPDMRGFGDDTDWGNGLNAFGDGIFESWHSAETITQTQTGLPNGFYTVVFLGMYRQDGGDAAPTLTLTSGGNSAKANLKALTEIDFGGCNGGNKWTGANKPDDKYSAGEALAHTDAGVKVENFFVENGELTVTVAMPSGSQWLLCQGFQIYFKAESLEQYANLFREALAAAEAVDATKLNTYVAGVLSTALGNAANEQVDKDWYQARVTELNNAVALANAVVTPYANVTNLIALCTKYAENSTYKAESDNTSLRNAIAQAQSDAETAPDAATLESIYNTLEAARQAYTQKAYPEGITFDMSYKMNTSWANGGGNYTAAGVVMKERYSGQPYTGEVMSTVITNLPNGVYDVQIYCNANAAMHDGTWEFTDGAELTSVHANAISTKIPVKITKGNDYANVITLNDVTVKDHTLTIKIVNDEKAANWIVVAHKSLTLKAGLDVSEQQSAVSALVEEANAIKEACMGATEQTALLTALENADATSENPDELEEMVTALQNAVSEAKVSIAYYEEVKTYITKANGIDESIAAEYQTQYDNRTLAGDAVTIFQNLEVATYNYVKDNFTYSVALSHTWNSTGTNTSAADVKGEHWSDDKEYTYKNQFDGWGDPKQGYPAGSWTIDFDQEVELPAGEYVFKVAGRKSVDATLELVVTMGETELGTVNDFPSSNEALGINKAGATSFDANDPTGFAKEGKGYGWQWRYVRFVLDEKATVKVAVHAGTNKIYNWVSFGDYTLQMTEETYLEANKGGLDAPTAAANLLVDTKPMGTAENNALKEALAMTYTTGAELQAKIEALETAVANANAWVTAYNEAKAPLVAALDRFEADYNNAENGALNHMNKNRWVTAIEKAQAAAVAKDATDSYEGFAAATEELVAALDAAQVSVDEYAALKSAIDNANTLANAGNWGAQPFQRPTSAKESLNTTTAQATYDAAEADGEGVTSVTDALNENVEAVDAIVLNAPAEGARYNMVMSAGWEHDGKAVTYLAGGRNDAGLYNIQYYAAPNANYAQAFTFTAVEGKANCYTLSMTDVDGNERYVCTGVVYGGNTSQIRTTTDAAQALAVKVIATTTDGIHQLYNTEANNYIGGQDAGFYTVNSHTTFRLKEAEKANVTLTLSEVGWATLILPFDAELPEGVKAYSCTEADGETLTLTEAESLKANTPYLMNGEKSTHVFTGYGLADKDSYTDGLFTGTYVDYQTTADGKTYVLQNQDGNLAFYLVTDAAQPWIRPYRSYMVYEGAAGAPKFSLGRGEGTTSIDKAQLTIDNVVIYDLMGRKVSTMEKGGVYIVNGKKVVIK